MTKTAEATEIERLVDILRSIWMNDSELSDESAHAISHALERHCATVAEMAAYKILIEK